MIGMVLPTPQVERIEIHQQHRDDSVAIDVNDKYSNYGRHYSGSL